MEVVTLKRRVFLHPIIKMSNEFLDKMNQHLILCEIMNEMKHSYFSIIPKQMTKFAVERANIPLTQESLHVKITNEDNAYFL
jgi:hypothetical protein